MFHVILKNDWYAPGDRYIPRGNAGAVHLLDDALKPFLPSSAVLVDSGGKRLPPVSRDAKLSDFDEAKAAGEALEYVTKQAEAQREKIKAAQAEKLLAVDDGFETPTPTLPAAPVAETTDETPGRRKPRTGG